MLYGTCAREGPAVRGGLLVCCVSHPGAQLGLDAVIMRDTRHVCVQPPAAAGLQLRTRGCQQPGGARRVVLLQRYGGQRLEVVGGGWLVSGFGRQCQPLPEQSCGAVQVTPGLAAC